MRPIEEELRKDILRAMPMFDSVIVECWEGMDRAGLTAWAITRGWRVEKIDETRLRLRPTEKEK